MFPLKSALIFSILFAFIVSGCSCFHEKPAQRVVVIKNVKRILMHEEEYYTIFFKDTTDNSSQLLYMPISCSESRFFVDVPQGGESWVKFIVYYYPDISEYKPLVSYCEFHIKRAQEINGAGWDHGKFGSGQTTVIE